MNSLASLYYHSDAYLERTSPAAGVSAEGIMGRQVAGQQFLDAYLTHGHWSQLSAVLPNVAQSDSLVRVCQEHSTSAKMVRRLQLTPEADYATRYASPDRPANVLHFPTPPDERFTWLRHSERPPPVALCGVTHTLASPQLVAALCSFYTAPFAPCDTLICTSQAVYKMVTTVLNDYGTYLAERFNGRLPALPRLEVIPLGVNPERFRTATPQERQASRASLQVADDELMVLCVGRLSHHAKAHPYPLFHATAEAARRTGKKIHLIFAGWSAHPAVTEAYRDGAERFAPGVRTSFVYGQKEDIREAVWKAADLFASLPDNIQETFGLVVLEAMASGLPVLASDWDGYRDLVVDGSTGFLIPTYSIARANRGASQRLLFGKLNYDQYLAECMQTFTVDPSSAAERMTHLLDDAELRRKMGLAGRKRIVDGFTWADVVRRYEALWAEMSKNVREFPPRTMGPANYPDVERTFGNYPTFWLDPKTKLAKVKGMMAPNHPLMNPARERRLTDMNLLAAVLSENSVHSLAEWIHVFQRQGETESSASATIAWLLKYGVLKLANGED